MHEGEKKKVTRSFKRVSFRLRPRRKMWEAWKGVMWLWKCICGLRRAVWYARLRTGRGEGRERRECDAGAGEG